MDSSPPPSTSNARRRLAWGLALASALLLLLPLGWALFGPRGVAVTVSAKTWQMDIDVEQYVLEGGSDWCDALPAGALNISRRMLMDPRRGVEAEYCRFSAHEWRRRWIARKEGEDPAPPRWPEPHLNPQPPDELGAQRLGKRQARYELKLQAEDGRHWTCPLPPDQWRRRAKGDQFRVQVDRQGTADCATIPE